jgi:hypothetical protein
MDAPARTGAAMPRYYFHQHLNGLLIQDHQGLQFGSPKEACEHAVYRMPIILKGLADPTRDTHLAIEVSDGTHTLSIIRGTITIEMP